MSAISEDVMSGSAIAICEVCRLDVGSAPTGRQELAARRSMPAHWSKVSTDRAGAPSALTGIFLLSRMQESDTNRGLGLKERGYRAGGWSRSAVACRQDAGPRLRLGQCVGLHNRPIGKRTYSELQRTHRIRHGERAGF